MASADPAAVASVAGGELVAALAELVERTDPADLAPDAVTALLDEVSTLLRRARQRIARARRAASPAALPATPASAAVPASPRPRLVQPAPVTPTAVVPAVVPAAAPRRRPVLARWLLAVFGLVVDLIRGRPQPWRRFAGRIPPGG